MGGGGCGGEWGRGDMIVVHTMNKQPQGLGVAVGGRGSQQRSHNRRGGAAWALHLQRRQAEALHRHPLHQHARTSPQLQLGVDHELEEGGGPLAEVGPWARAQQVTKTRNRPDHTVTPNNPTPTLPLLSLPKPILHLGIPCVPVKLME